MSNSIKRSINDTWNGLVKSAPAISLEKRACPLCGSDKSESVSTGIDFECRSVSNHFEFRRCASCDGVYLNPRPASADLAKIYPKDYYYSSSSQVSKRGNRFVQMLWDAAERRRMESVKALVGKPRAKILDIGCGQGRLLKVIKGSLPEWELVGVDLGINDELSALGIKTYRDIYEKLDLKDGPFDLIFAQQVIEHAIDPAGMLRKMYEDLTPGGYVIIDTPNFASMDRKLFSKHYWSAYHFPRHMTLFTKGTLSSLASSCGFNIIKSQKLFSPVGWAVSVHNALLGRGLNPKLADRIHYQAFIPLCAAGIIELFFFTCTRESSNMRIIVQRPL